MKNSSLSRSRWYVAFIFVACVLLLSSLITLADTQNPAFSNMASTDCYATYNPDECYLRQTSQKWAPFKPDVSMLPLSTETLGLEGPFSADIKYDSTLDWILGLKYLHMFSNSVGIATKFTGGQNELRANITAGIALDKDQQIKLTYEYLRQNLPFNFISGSVNEWVDQHSLGVSYQYVIRDEILHSLEISGYTTHANSKNLSNVVFNQQVLTGGTAGYLYDMNYRHIAGGTENTVLASLNIFPFGSKSTILTLGAGYSDIRYDTLYEDNQATSRLAYKIELAQLLTAKTKLTAGVNASAASAAYSVGLNQLLPKKIEASLKGQYDIGQGTLPDNKNITLALNYPAADSYSLTEMDDLEALKTWIDKPVLYSSRVLAIKDEKVEHYEFVTSGSIPEQALFYGDSLSPITTSNFFKFNDPGIQNSYNVTTKKILAANPNDHANKKDKTTTETRDYTSDLKLQLVSNGSNQATLQSSAPIPSLDSHDQPTAGAYTVLLTGVASSTGKSFDVTQGFKLTIKGEHGPTWNPNFVLPPAQMGQAYPPPSSISSQALNKDIDLTQQITLLPTDTSVKITFATEPGCTAPTWLNTLAPCANEPTHTCLSSGDQVVPNTASDQNFCVAFTATDSPSETATTKKFADTPIHQLPPVWQQNIPPIYVPLSTPVGFTIPLNLYLTNTKGLNITPGADFDHTHWEVVSDGTLFNLRLTKIYSEVSPSPNLTVEATNSTSYGSQSKNIPVVIDAKPTYVATWNNVDSLPNGTWNKTYSVNLNAGPDGVPSPLATTVDKNNNPVNPPDIYTFSVSDALPDGWTLTNNVLAHKAFTTTDPSTVEIKLIAVGSASYDSSQVSNGQPKTFKISINQPTARWNPTISSLPDGAVGSSYRINLNAVYTDDGKRLAITYDANEQPIEPADAYVFHADPDQPMPAGWSFEYQGDLKHDAPFTQADMGTVKIPIQANSVLDQTIPVTDEQGQKTKVFTLQITPPAPQFDPGALNQQIRFNLTGDNTYTPHYPGLGYVSQGIDLNSAISNADSFSSIAFTIQNPDDYPNWQIRKDYDLKRNYHSFLVRKTDKPVKINSGSSVSAKNIGTVVAIDIKATGVSKEGSQDLSNIGTFKIKVNEDLFDDISYDFEPTEPSVIALISVTSNGAGARATLEQKDLTLHPPAKTYASRDPAGSQYDVYVADDEGEIYASTHPLVEVNNNRHKATFLTPQTREFRELTNPSNLANKSYLTVQSKADGQRPRSINLLPPLTSNRLVIVPFKGALLNGRTFSDPDNLSANVTVGIDGLFTYCAETGRSTTTGLSFMLPKLPAGKIYSFTSFHLKPPNSFTPKYVATGICRGTNETTNLSLTPTGQTPYPGCGSGSTAWQIPTTLLGPFYKECSGSSTDYHTVLNWRGNGGSGPDNVYTVYGYGTYINRGSILKGDIPSVYEGMNLRPVPQAVMSFGQDYVNYSDFPVVVALPF